MALRASFAALLMLGGSISAVSAAEAPAPIAAAPENDADLPRFVPLPETPAMAVSVPVVQPIPEPDAQGDDDAVHDLGSGVASWYGTRFAGRPTASGERFDPDQLTAAHRTLPFGSKVRVTRGDRSVIVRINDRGPFHSNRVIDLSEAAAEKLGLRSAGSGRVELALLEG